MPNLDIPFLGTIVLSLTLIAAAYSFATAVVAGRGRPQMLVAARYSTYATCALVAVGVCVLAYAFQTHDFRIRYVARYSDRSMAWSYLITSLWGGQDGSLLWWSFLLCGYTAAVTRWMRGRYAALQPWVLATLMSILMFFLVTMLFAANPFATIAGTAPTDGEGLNPLLQNYWMTIHPPSLYLGFVGWSVPFAFAVAALITGRLHDEWTIAARKWALLAWLFLSIGLVLGMIWSYEELGWGGYWAWDPVENASFMPWLVGTAYLHSVLVQERYQMLKVWNVFLILLTFFMTIFGTFLTRSGLIASVHSFARSDIGIYFAYYMVFLIVVGMGLVVWRLPRLKAVNRIESLVSREFAFLLNNWILLGMMVFVLVATTFPLLSEWLRGEEVTVGPPFYNKWMIPLGLILLLLLGIGPLISWRKASGKNLLEAFRMPVLTGVVMGGLHLVFGKAIGLPAMIESDAIYDTTTGVILAAIFRVAPVLCSSLSFFVLGTIAQEFWRGTRVRMKNADEGPLTALVGLVSRAKRRYGGYIIHVGMVFMYLGFAGSAYDVEKEAALKPGETFSIAGYKLRYERPRMTLDPNKRMLFADVSILDDAGKKTDTVSPAKFIYKTHPEMPTTEVAIRSRPANDLYLIMSTIDPTTKRATFRAIVRPLVMWIWIGAFILLFGTIITMAPSVKELLGETEGPRMSSGGSRLAATVAVVLLGVLITFIPRLVHGQSDSTSSLHAGSVVIDDPEERVLFNRLLCMCGDCQRLPLDSCACGWAERKRAELRGGLSSGASVPDLISSYRAEHGSKSISVPGDSGLDRALWAVPVAAIALSAGGIVWMGRRWKRRSAGADSAASRGKTGEDAAAQAYDDRIDAELRQLDE